MLQNPLAAHSVEVTIGKVESCYLTDRVRDRTAVTTGMGNGYRLRRPVNSDHGASGPDTRAELSCDLTETAASVEQPLTFSGSKNLKRRGSNTLDLLMSG